MIPALSILTSSPVVADQCQLVRFAAAPVTMNGLRPTVWTEIDGVKALFTIDTGAFWSTLSPPARAKYKLFDETVGTNHLITGANGSVTQYTVATADNFTFLNVQFRKTTFVVEDFDVASSADAAGSIGENLLRTTDVEYDFADGLMRFARPSHCGDRALAYWAGQQPFGVVDLQPADGLRDYLVGRASVNGREIRVLFDTGSPRSVLSLAAARLAGITPESPGVERAGAIEDIGGKAANSWIAPLALFQIGNEKISGTHVLVSDFGDSTLHAEMILGADFFLSHHVYVANSQNKLYFTYNGGPVFDLGRSYLIKRGGSAPVLVGSDSAASSLASFGQRGTTNRSSTSAELMRQGIAYASEQRYALALSNLDRACRLEPRNPECLFQRGKVYAQNEQPEKALADFDAAIGLQPDLYRARVARAKLLIDRAHAPADAAVRAKADADFVDTRAPAESELRLQLAALYDDMEQYAAALREVSQWMQYHGKDIDLASALNMRCWVRAEADRDLEGALDDCNRALQRWPNSSEVLDSRGLLYLRRREFQLSMDDYDSALKANPKIPTSLYGRGVAELRLGKKESGQSDLAAAVKLDPGIAARFARMGLSP